MPDQDESRPVPPYAPFATLLHQLERMERDGVPGRIDKTYLIGMAGGTQNQLKHAMRSLGLITEHGEATQVLVDLAKKPDERAQLLARILRERYPTLAGLSQDATRGQLDEVLAEYGLNGVTARKAATFFVLAATYAGIPLSPHIKPAKASPGTGTRRTGRKRRSAAQVETAGDTTNRDGVDDMKRVYFNLLVDKAKESDADSGTDLLDRIERLIGVDAVLRSEGPSPNRAVPDGSKPED
jgi:hypothetical protein